MLDKDFISNQRSYFRPVATIFQGGRGAYLKNQDQMINVWIIRYATLEDPRGRVSNLRTIKLKSGDFWWYRKLLRASKARASGGGGVVGACFPKKFSILKALKRHFQDSQADSCVEKVPKIDRYFFS